MNSNKRTWRNWFRYVPHERRRSHILGILLLGSAVVAVVIQRFVLGIGVVVGQSMDPTLEEGDRYVIHRWLYLVRAPEIGDIVVVRDPVVGDLAVKRVVAGPGDKIQITNGHVYVNGAMLDEPYIADRGWTPPNQMGRGLFEVAPDCYFVMGDNRRFSFDSRNYGAIERSNVLGYVNPGRLN